MNWVDNALFLVTQEIEGPVEIHGGGSVFAKKVEGKGKEKEVIIEQQPPKQKPSIRIFTTDFKPRLRWTPELHAHFVDALNELGGPHKVTPKRLLDAIGIEGLEIRHIKSHLQGTSEELVDQHNGGADADAARMSQQDLACVAATPSSYSIQETRHPKNNTADRMKECSGLQQKISCSACLQSENIAYSAIAGCIDSQGYSFPYNSADAVSVHVFLQNEVHTSNAQSATDGLQSRNTAYSTTNGFNVNHSQIMAYPQDYHPESASFSFKLQNASYKYYPPQSAANSNQLQDAVFKCLPQAAAYGYQPQNAAYSSLTNLPTSKGQFSETAYMDDLNATLAAIGNTSQDTINFDPVNTYINWDNLDINPKDNDLSFEMKEQSGHMESLATQRDRKK